MRLSVRRIVAGAAAALVLAACATPQTLVPYTPAAGVNNGPRAEVPNPGDDRHVLVRNLLIVTTGDGSGFLSGSLASRGEAVALRDVSGAPVRADGTVGTAFVRLRGVDARRSATSAQASTGSSSGSTRRSPPRPSRR